MEFNSLSDGEEIIMIKGILHLLPTSEILAQEAAKFIQQRITDTLQQKKRCSISLSGGNTPRKLYQVLASEPYLSSIPWNQIDFFWGDERCVPPDHPDSDYLMAKEMMLDAITARWQPGIYRIETEHSPAEAAARYEKTLREYFSDSSSGFDILLLGMGEDGHTASLFPFTQALHETKRWVVENYVPKLQTWRVTLTAHFLNRAVTTMVLVSGTNKRDVFMLIQTPGASPETFPILTIQPASGELHWFVDKDAFSENVSG